MLLINFLHTYAIFHTICRLRRTVCTKLSVSWPTAQLQQKARCFWRLHRHTVLWLRAGLFMFWYSCCAHHFQPRVLPVIRYHIFLDKFPHHWYTLSLKSSYSTKYGLYFAPKWMFFFSDEVHFSIISKIDCILQNTRFCKRICLQIWLRAVMLK